MQDAKQNDNLSEKQKLRFEYAWKWFSFHAEQRTKMFNFMLIVMGLFAAALASAIDKELFYEASALSVFAMVVSFAFWMLDLRNRHLYMVGMNVLVREEKTVLFNSEPGIETHEKEANAEYYGLASCIANEDKYDTFFDDIFKRKHSFWMPFVAFLFTGLFAIAALWTWHLASQEKLSASVVNICCWSSSPPTESSNTIDPPKPTTPETIGIARGEGSISNMSLAWLFTGLALVAAGVAVIVVGKKIALGVGSIALGLASGFVPNISIPFSAEFNFEPKFEAKMFDRVDIKVKKLLEIARQSESGLIASARFGGFGSGAELLECGAEANKQAVTHIRTAIAKAGERQQGVILLLVGGTDREHLSQTLRARYDSNSGLARARVNQVEHCLGLDQFNETNSEQSTLEIIRVITGPSYTPEDRDSRGVAEKRMAEDREVSVFVIGIPLRDI